MLRTLPPPPFRQFFIPAKTLVITVTACGQISSVLTGDGRKRTNELSAQQAAAIGALDRVQDDPDEAQDAYDYYFETNVSALSS